MEVTRAGSGRGPGRRQASTGTSLLESGEQRRGLARLRPGVREAGAAVPSSRTHAFPFRANRRNGRVPGPVLGAPERRLRVQPAPRRQADDLHGVLLSVWRGLGHAVRPLPHEGLR